MPRVAILDDYQSVALRVADWSALDRRAEITVFADHMADRDRLVERLRRFDIIVAMRERTPFPRAVLERLPALRLLVTTGMVNRSIDLEAATALGIQVSGTRTVVHPTAELTWGLILALTRRIPAEAAALRAGRWQTGLGTGLHGKVLGVLGLGKLGSRVAGFGRAFGMEVLAWSRNLTAERAAEHGAVRVDKDELLERADIVTLHLVLGDTTHGLIGRAELRRMKPTAYLVNTARGALVDEAALIEALAAGTIAGAALDVFEHEPLPADHPFRRLDTLLMTPHIGYVTEETYRTYYADAVENIRAWLDGTVMRPLNAPG